MPKPLDIPTRKVSQFPNRMTCCFSNEVLETFEYLRERYNAHIPELVRRFVDEGLAKKGYLKECRDNKDGR